MALDSMSEDAQPLFPDLGSAVTRDWPHRKYPNAPRPHHPGIIVLLKQSVVNDVHRHGYSRPDVEICGVLVGNGYQDETGSFVYVEATIRGEHASNQMAQVTFTAATWNHIQAVMDRDHPEQKILGWYHTHPGFGIFLSSMDLFIHGNFFASPEQLALVYDPLSGEQGVFLWRAGLAARETVLIEEDEPPIDERAIRRPAVIKLPTFPPCLA